MTTVPVALAAVILALAGTASAQERNILLVIADDLGVDMVAAYGEHPDPARTPVIDQLAADGVLFRNVWSNPTCSPTRATILTGRYAFRTGIGIAIWPERDPTELSINEVSLADVLKPDHSTVAIGKWHLGTDPVSGLFHPLLLGFDQHLGAPWNFADSNAYGYYEYDKAVNGQLVLSDVYATTDTVDDALALSKTLPEPWFLWVAFNASHTPVHKPPHILHTYALPPNIEDDVPLHTKAVTEAMDTELGRLLDGLPVDTTVIFVGDNGSHASATTPPFIPTQSKGTLYEGGINVPLIIKGPDIAVGAECEALVNTTDLFATIAQLAGEQIPPDKDAVSLVPYLLDPAKASIRDWVYSERFAPNGFGPYFIRRVTAREARYKLMRQYTPLGEISIELLFDLDTDPFEQVDLLQDALTPEELDAHRDLQEVLDDLASPWTDVGFALSGSNGEPELVGNGSLLPGDPVAISMSGALGSAPASLVFGVATLYAPFKGGVMVPAPAGTWPILIGPEGNFVLSSVWPEMPPGTPIHLQVWIQDPGGPAGYAASNAIVATSG